MKFRKISGTYQSGEVFEVIRRHTGDVIGYVRSSGWEDLVTDWAFRLNDGEEWDWGHRSRGHAADQCRREWNRRARI